MRFLDCKLHSSLHSFSSFPPRMTYRSLLMIGTIVLAACSPTGSSPHSQKSGGHTPSQAERENLLVRDQSSDGEIAFSIRKGDETFTDYGINHTKEMHLIVVRDDLQNFQHIHPERDAEGIWHITFTPPFGGTYWFYADYVEKDGTPHTLHFEREYTGDLGTTGIDEDFATEQLVDGYRITMSSNRFADGVQFNYEIFDSKGQPVALEQYLGEKGHSILLTASGEYIHAHAFKDYVYYKESDPPVFITPPLKPDTLYRIFSQFQIRGKVVTAIFDWKEERWIH